MAEVALTLARISGSWGFPRLHLPARPHGYIPSRDLVCRHAARSFPMPCHRREPSERTVAAAVGIAPTPSLGSHICSLALSTRGECFCGLPPRSHRRDCGDSSPELRIPPISCFAVTKDPCAAIHGKIPPRVFSFLIVCVDALGFTFGPLAWLLRGVRMSLSR
jgi:hypothetical protein